MRASSLAAALWAVLAEPAPAHGAGSAEPVPFYFQRPITSEDLRGKTLAELELLRATILGRAGLVFLDRRVRDYLAEAEWYESGKYDPNRLSAIDVQNLRTLATFRAAMPRAELKKRWDALLLEHRYAADAAMQHRLAFSEDGSVAAAGGSVLLPPRASLALFRTTTGERISTIRWATGALHAVRFVGNELVVASGYDVRQGDGAPSTRASR